jgi:hypothetical protein
MEFGFAWARAVDVNDAGIVLVVAYTGGIAGVCKALLWDPLAETVVPVGNDEPDGVYPMSLTSDNSILGNARNRSGETIPCLSDNGAPWQRLGTPDGWYATAMNSECDVVGSFIVDGFTRPWLRRSDGEVVWLPYLAYHHCRPVAIADSGMLVGDAATDHGSHALLWSLAS